MPTEVSGKKYIDARNGQEKSWNTLFILASPELAEAIPENKYGRLLIFFCRHNNVVLAVYARLNFAAGKVWNTSKRSSR